MSSVWTSYVTPSPLMLGRPGAALGLAAQHGGQAVQVRPVPLLQRQQRQAQEARGEQARGDGGASEEGGVKMSTTLGEKDRHNKLNGFQLDIL